ncbi:MAG: hypothetical protein KDJ54_07370 [Candidatus Competibacteraceae bacterium]|nr:hypothetical protein [Candidatus Competibacteraceae bacterium]
MADSPVVYGHPELRELELTINGRLITRPLRTEHRQWLRREWAVRV